MTGGAALITFDLSQSRYISSVFVIFLMQVQTYLHVRHPVFTFCPRPEGVLVSPALLREAPAILQRYRAYEWNRKAL
jgi:hypothetical protein